MVHEALKNGPVNKTLKTLRDKKIEERIQEHVKNIREYRTNDRVLSVEDEVRIAKNNLDEVILSLTQRHIKSPVKHDSFFKNGGAFLGK